MRQQHLKELEKQRGEILTILYICIGIGVVGLLSFFILPVLGIFICLAVISLCPFAVSDMRKNYIKNFKFALLTKKLDAVGFEDTFKNIIFIPEKGFEYGFIKNIGMITMGNRYYSEDYITGKYNGVSFEQSFVLMQNISDKGKDKSTQTYFQGRFMRFEFDKEITAYAEKTEKLKEELNAVLNAKANNSVLIKIISNQLYVAINNSEYAFEPAVYSEINADNYNDVYKDIGYTIKFACDLV